MCHKYGKPIWLWKRNLLGTQLIQSQSKESHGLRYSNFFFMWEEDCHRDLNAVLIRIFPFMRFGKISWWYLIYFKNNGGVHLATVYFYRIKRRCPKARETNDSHDEMTNDAMNSHIDSCQINHMSDPDQEISEIKYLWWKFNILTIIFQNYHSIKFFRIIDSVDQN